MTLLRRLCFWASSPLRCSLTPWIAASGSFVAVAWGASADGKADVSTLDEPSRVQLQPVAIRPAA